MTDEPPHWGQVEVLLSEISIKMKQSLRNLSIFLWGGGICFRIDFNSLGPKKNERWTLLLSWCIVIIDILVLLPSYSWCTQVTRGGFRAFKISLCQTGKREGALAPLANSPTAFKKFANPKESLIG
jgi:hypothetical protein